MIVGIIDAGMSKSLRTPDNALLASPDTAPAKRASGFIEPVRTSSTTAFDIVFARVGLIPSATNELAIPPPNMENAPPVIAASSGSFPDIAAFKPDVRAFLPAVPAAFVIPFITSGDNPVPSKAVPSAVFKLPAASAKPSPETAASDNAPIAGPAIAPIANLSGTPASSILFINPPPSPYDPSPEFLKYS